MGLSGTTSIKMLELYVFGRKLLVLLGTERIGLLSLGLNG